MKKFYLAGVPALLGVLFLLQVPSSGPAHAISGCCKQPEMAWAEKAGLEPGQAQPEEQELEQEQTLTAD